MILFVFQHPLQYSQRLGVSQEHNWHPLATRRLLRHKADTALGSSGGLCVDSHSFEAVALHQAGSYDTAGKLQHNWAIPMAKIREAADSSGKFGDIQKVDPELDPLWCLKDSVPGRLIPVIGRCEFQALVWSTVSGARPIVIIHGQPQSGKSFSIDILRSLLPISEHKIVSYDAADIPIDALEFVTSFLSQISPAGPTSLPTADCANTTTLGWLKNVLTPAFRSRLGEAPGPAITWLVIDNLDRQSLPDGTTRAFLEVLCRSIRSIPRLRILLIGLSGDVLGASFNDIAYYEVPRLSPGDVGRWLRCYCIDKRVRFTEQEADRMGHIIASINSCSKNTNAALAELVVHHVMLTY